MHLLNMKCRALQTNDHKQNKKDNAINTAAHSFPDQQITTMTKKTKKIEILPMII